MTVATAFKGTLVHCPSLGQLEVLEDHILREDFIVRSWRHTNTSAPMPY
jgi:hypothetical protein